ncbi:curlin [Candidatus Poribacteria bacterium]|nr:curlin [Candidatus Poribacteria bacterium]
MKERANLGRKVTPTYSDLTLLPPPEEKLVAAVYRFQDQTGQYKTDTQGITYSRAVTQGAASMLIKALEDCGWFTLVEREGVNNLLQERELIRSTRMQYQAINSMVKNSVEEVKKENSDKQKNNQSGNNGKNTGLPALPPLLYAGIILEGGIVAYDTNIVTGGVGERYFGLGGSAQFRKDQVTVCLRAIAVKTGSILKSVYATKTVLSREVDVGLYRFINVKRLMEVEAGYSTNEPLQMCVMEAIDKAVIAIVIEGILDGYWTLKNSEDIKSPVIMRYLEERGENGARILGWLEKEE